MSSIFQRYISKFTSNFLGLLAGIVTTLVVPRALGPAQYGDFNFLKDSFDSLVSTIDLNASNAHFIFSCRNEKSDKVTLFYLYFSLLVGIVLIALTTFFFSDWL